jgi:F-type H+-transporting ATPase subunit gamma
LRPEGDFSVLSSVKVITPLIGQILIESRMLYNKNEDSKLFLFYNRPRSKTLYEPASQRLLPLDEIWQQELIELEWPAKPLPEIIGKGTETLRALIDEYFRFPFQGMCRIACQ